MSAKRPAPRTAKGKKPASRASARKTVARAKPEAAARIRSAGISRRFATFDPMALISVPGLIHADSITGSFDDVAVSQHGRFQTPSVRRA